MLQPVQAQSYEPYEDRVLNALEYIREDVENGVRRRTLRKRLERNGIPSGVIAETLRRIFDDDAVIIEISQRR